MRYLTYFRAIFISCCLAFVAVTVTAEEKITNFDVRIDVQKSGDILVTETIDVIAEGQQIRRGIYRDIPRFLVDDDGYKLPQDFKVSKVTLNGKRETYETTTEGNAFRIRIGNANVFLEPGAYQYAITYRAPNQIRYRKTADELYWNVTGTHWNFSMDKVSAMVIFPDGAQFTDISAYTGRKGSTAQDYKSAQAENGVLFETTQALQRRENMTVSVSIAKGLIDPPTQLERSMLWWAKNGALATLIASLLGIWGFYTRAWNKVGRDPVKGPVIPLYEPPKGYSAAACSYIHYKGVSKHRALISTLMGLANKGKIHIDAESKKRTVLTANSYTHESPALDTEQAEFFTRLFGSGSGTVTLKGKYNNRFTSAYMAFQKHLTTHYGKAYYKLNGGYHFLGLVLTMAAVGFAMSQASGNLRMPFFAVLGALALLNIIFFKLLPAPTDKGQKIMTQIEGFKLYMETAEKERLNDFTIGKGRPPPMTKERYEAMLPYAVALGVEKPWTEHFEAVMPVEAERYQHSGISGNFMSGQSLGRMNDSMMSNINSGVTRAAPSSSSSSGSSGGGSSGGGGGGGGGGGW